MNSPEKQPISEPPNPRNVRLAGTHEIRVLLGNPSNQRVHQLTHRPTFPAPVARLTSGRVWDANDIEAWIAEQRQPNTPDNRH